MIYTVTFNPSLDYIVRLDQFTAGEINRVSYEQVLAGGKGINVSIVLHNLGHESTALGFVAGFTGDEIERQLDAFSVRHDFVRLDAGFSRINVKAKAQSETEINGQGPDISEAKQQEAMDAFERLAFAGMDPEQYDITWVRHQHTEGGRVELHFVTPRMELTTGKALNIAPPGWERSYAPLRDALNWSHGWARPDDPDRATELHRTPERAHEG